MIILFLFWNGGGGLPFKTPDTQKDMVAENLKTNTYTHMSLRKGKVERLDLQRKVERPDRLERKAERPEGKEVLQICRRNLTYGKGF